jgi:caa(3)-type oxidase subunit IV
MNNPPDISQDSKEYEEYAHGIRKHVRGYLMVGALLLAFTAITVALSYVHFGTQKANIAVAMLVATLKAGLVAAIFMHLAAEKRLIYRVLIFTGFFVIVFSTLLALGTGVWCLWVNLVEGAPIYVAGAVASFVVAIALMVYGVWFYRKMKRLRIIT